MDKRAVLDALDRAVYMTALAEYKRLTANRTENEAVLLRDQARFEAFKLNQTDMPDYDNEMVAVFYAAMYQLQHINLAYSVIKDFVNLGNYEEAITDPAGTLQVVDFGAGGLAMQFGLTLAVADALEAGQAVKAVYVDSIDLSLPMMFLGDKIWERFKEITGSGKNGRLRWVNEACQLVEHEFHDHVGTISVVKESNAWLSAIHAIYETTVIDVRNDLAEVYSRIQPVAGFITCYGNHEGQGKEGNTGLARIISPFTPSKFELRLLSGNPRIQDAGGVRPLPMQFAYYIDSRWVRRVTRINEEWGLINSDGTMRTETSVLNWTWDTAVFAFKDNKYQKGTYKKPVNEFDDIDDLPF